MTSFCRVATTQWLRRDQTLPLSAKGVACETKEGSGHIATIELSPQQKLAVTNEIWAFCRLHLLSWSSNYVTACLAEVSILLSNGTV